MSWPTDGLPRFVVAVTEGFLKMPKISSGRNESSKRTQPNATWAILDRGNCHREVARFRTEDHPSRSIAAARVSVAAVAAARLSELNGEAVAS